MGFLRKCTDVEKWLSNASTSWSGLTDSEYQQLISNWKKVFWNAIETSKKNPHGLKAQIKFENILPKNAYVFSGIRVGAAANMGGKYPLGYLANELSNINWSLCLAQELIITDAEFTYSIVCSHEDGYEQYYENV